MATLEEETGHSLITIAAPKNSLLIKAMRYTKNRAESVEEKGHTVQILQQHKRAKNLVLQQHRSVKNLAPQIQQNGTWRNRPHQKAYSPGTQLYENKNRNRIGNRKKKRTTSAKAHLQVTAYTQKPIQERDQRSETKNRGHQQSSRNPVRSCNTRSRDSRAGNFLPDTWERNLRWSTKTMELVPDQPQPSPTIPGKLSHSPTCIIPSTSIRSLPFFSNNHPNKKNRNVTSYRKQDQLTMQNKRKRIELVKQRPWRIMEVEARSQSNSHVPTKTRQKIRRPKTSKMLIIDNNQCRDYIHDADSHRTMAHDLHDGTHDVDAKKHKNHECPNKTKEAPQEAQHGVTASRRRTKREDNIKRRQLFKNVPKVSTELRGRKDSLSD